MNAAHGVKSHVLPQGSILGPFYIQHFSMWPFLFHGRHLLS